MGAPRRTNWMLSITMLGRMRTTRAAFTSITRLSSGVPSVGKPKPMAPLRRAESRTMPAARIALRTDPSANEAREEPPHLAAGVHEGGAGIEHGGRRWRVEPGQDEGQSGLSQRARSIQMSARRLSL